MAIVDPLKKISLFEEEQWESELLHSFSEMHLQWFAAEDEGRTEDASDRQVQKAREEGKVVKSQEMSGAVILLVMMLACFALARYMLEEVLHMLQYFFITSVTKDIVLDRDISFNFYFYLIKLLLPFFLITVLISYLINFVQVGALVSLKAIEPKFSKIAPNFTKWFQKSFLSPEAGFNLFKTLIKVGSIIIVVYINIKKSLPYMSDPDFLSIIKVLNFMSYTGFKIIVQSSLVMLIFAVPDYFFQRWQHAESLKMTKHDIKQEFKEQEGDPQIKNRLRQRMRQLLEMNLTQEIPRSDVVITNPTHYAVALLWDSTNMDAPVVLAKGEDNTALRIRRLATENEVPIIENKPLARALYASVEVGDTIPEQYWEVVSKILAEVYRISDKQEQVAQ